MNNNKYFDDHILWINEFEMDYPNARHESPIYDGHTHIIFSQRLVRTTLPNGREIYILMYIEDTRTMLTFVEINGHTMTKVPLDTNSYDMINIAELFYRGFDCSQLLSSLNRHIFCKPLTSYYKLIEDKPLEKDDGKYKTAAASLRKNPPNNPPNPPDNELNLKEQELYMVEKEQKELDNPKPKKESIGVFVDSEERWFLGDFTYNAIFFKSRMDVKYLPLNKNVAGHFAYNLLTEDEKIRLKSMYSINRINVNDIDVYIDGENEYLSPDLYELIFDKKVQRNEVKYIKLSVEEKKFINSYYAKNIVPMKRKLNVQEPNKLPKCINFNHVFYVRPDIAYNYHLVGLAVRLKYKDSNGEEKEGMYLDVPYEMVLKSNIIPDMNNSHEMYFPSELLIEGKKQRIYNLVTDQNGRKFFMPSRVELDELKLEPYAVKQTVIVDGFEESRWLIEITPEMESVYKVLSSKYYPVFISSSSIIERVQNNLHQ